MVAHTLRFILAIFLLNFAHSAAVIDLTGPQFRKEVLGKDNTFFVMFGMKECAPCEEMAPQYEKLAKNMKAIGIKVGKINCDEQQDIARQFNIQQVPKLMLFRPNKEPVEYQGDRTEKSMKTFILDHQLGDKQVNVLTKEKSIDKFFNESGRIPRLLLISGRKDVPPVFKQLCYHYRRGLLCGFASELHETLPLVKDGLKKFGTVDTDNLDYPVVYIINPKGDPRLVEYPGKHNYEAMKEFSSEYSTWKEPEDPEEKKEREKRERAEEHKRKRQEERAAKKEQQEKAKEKKARQAKKDSEKDEM